MRTFHLGSRIWLPTPPGEVFPFFADPSNLELLTPPWLRFEILTLPPAGMAVGARLDYRLRLRSIPVSWQSEITRWDPPHAFTDEQRRGPYRRWVHRHGFAEQDGGTLVTDDVAYAVAGGRLLNHLLVQPDLRRIFAYRRACLRTRFGAPAG